MINKEQILDAGQAVMEEAEKAMHEAENLLHDVGGAGNEAMVKVKERLKEARRKLHTVEAATREKACAAAAATDQYVRENPWRSVGAGVGIAAAAGLVIGMLISRNR